MTEQEYLRENKEDEIDLIAIAKTLWNGRRIIIWSAVIGLVIGVFVAFMTPKQYTVTSVIVPQYSGKSTSGGLSALASMAGINIGSSDAGGEISPLLYPQIVQSVPFQLELMNTPVHFQDVDHPVSIYEYYTEYAKPTVFSILKKYTIGLPRIILSVIRPNKVQFAVSNDSSELQIVKLTEVEDEIYRFLTKSVQLEANAKEGYLIFTSTMSEPLVATEIGQLAQDILQRYVINFKTQKSKDELDFIQERYNEAKAEMEQKQYYAAASADKIKFLTNTTSQLSTTRAQINYQISNAVFLELAKQLEQAKIQVNKDTPTFTIVQPVVVPVKPSGFSKLSLLFIMLIISVILGVILVLINTHKENVIQKWKANE